jgi:hypothetical protein
MLAWKLCVVGVEVRIYSGPMNNAIKSKSDLFSVITDHSSSTKEFAKSAAVLAHSEEHINLAKALSQLGDVYDLIEHDVSNQAHTDFFVFAELLKDYIGLLELIKEAFYQRIKIFQNWQKAEETLKAKQETKAKLEASNKQDKIPTAMAEIKTVCMNRRAIDYPNFIFNNENIFQVGRKSGKGQGRV